jgi:hypothetical protein
MVPTAGQPAKREGLGAVNGHTGDTVGLLRRRTRRREVAARLQAVVDKPPPGTIDRAWDHADPQAADEAEAIVRAAAGRSVLLSWPP